MSARPIALLCLLVFFAVSAQPPEPTVVRGTTGSDKEPMYLNAFIKHNDEASYGLGKLSEAERGRWNGLFQTILARLEDNLRNSATRYLTRQGWSEVKVTGTEMLKLDPGTDSMQYVIAELGGQRLVLEPKRVASLAAGSYWGRRDSSDFRIIDATGGTVEFQVRTTGPAEH